MRKSKLAKAASVFAVFLLVSAAMPYFSFRSVAATESAGLVPPPNGDGPYSIGWIDRDFTKTGGGSLSASIYYPSTAIGGESDPNMAYAPYPTLLFSPGFQSLVDPYRPLAARVASWGFVFAIVNSTPGVWDSERASNLVDTLNWLVEQNHNSSFKLTQMIDESKLGVLGHSLGGEAAIMVSLSDTRLKVVVPIAPFISYPMTAVSTESARDLHVPFLLLVGSMDVVAPPSSMAYPFYSNGNPSKFCVTLMGDDHLSVIFTYDKYAFYVVSFMQTFLCGSQEYARYLYGVDAQEEAAGGMINLEYDLRKTVWYGALSKGVAYNVSVYSDSTFLVFSYSENLNEMNFILTGPPYTSGTANVTIPKQLVGDYDIQVYLDEESYPFTLSNSSDSCSVYLAYNHSQHELAIRFVDLIPPTLVITSPIEGSLSNSTNATVGWSSEDTMSGLDHFEAKIDAKDWINVGNVTAYTFTELEEGNHTAYVKAFDGSGNSEETSVDFMVDTTAPFISILSPASDSVLNSPNATAGWSGGDSGSGIERYEVRLDNNAWIYLGTNTSYVFVELADGNHTVYVLAVDNVGNARVANVSFRIQKDSGLALLWVQPWFLAVCAVIILFSVSGIVYAARRKRTSSVAVPAHQSPH